MVFTFRITLKPCSPAICFVYGPNYSLLHFIVISFKSVKAISEYYSLNTFDEILNLAFCPLPPPFFWHGHLLFQGYDPKQRDSVKRAWVNLSTVINMLIFGELKMGTAPQMKPILTSLFFFLFLNLSPMETFPNLKGILTYGLVLLSKMYFDKIYLEGTS